MLSSSLTDLFTMLCVFSCPFGGCLLVCGCFLSFSFLTPCCRVQDKKLKVFLNGNRKVIGTLRGYDAFLNVVLEDGENDNGEYFGQIVIRGNSIIQFEGLERV